MKPLFLCAACVLSLYFFACKKTDAIPAPVIASFSPGSDTVGGHVSITGVNFSSDLRQDQVSINGTSAEVVTASSTSIQFIVPPGANSDFITLVVNGQKTISNEKFNVISPLGSLVISNVLPDTATVGSTVTITGSNFASDINGDSVWFNGVAAPITSATSTQIVTTVPFKASSGKIKVAANHKFGLTARDFGVPTPTITSFNPVTDSSGAIITISGTNFSTFIPFDSVKFNGVPAQITEATPTSLKAYLPGNASTGKVTVMVGVQTVSSTQSFTVTLPEIFGVQNMRDTVGATVTISGNNFSSDPLKDTVRFGSAQAKVISASANQLMVVVPPGAVSGYIDVKIGSHETIATMGFIVTGVSTLAGSGNQGSQNGQGMMANFGTLSGAITVDTLRNVFVFDYAYHKIRKITPAGFVSNFSGSGQPGTMDGDSSTAGFNWVDGLAAIGYPSLLYASDGVANNIRRISSMGAASTLATGYAHAIGIAEDHMGNAYFCSAPNTISKISADGKIIRIAGGSANAGYVDGDTSIAQFNNPGAIASDPYGNIYVADGGNFCVRKITRQGQVSTLAGSGSQGLAVDGHGTAASFYTLQSMVIDHGGNLYVVDLNCIRKITPSGDVSTIAGSIDPGYQEGGLLNARFNQPNGIGIDDDDYLYISDMGNRRIRKITPY